MNQMTDELAVRKSVFVRCTPEHAFHVYTERMTDWYPIEGHSIFDDPQSTVVWEGYVGGRVYERSSKSEEGVWGTIVVWDPPNELTMTWHPDRGEETAQELNIRFTSEGDGTRVDVVHTGWERHRARLPGRAWPATTRAGAPCSRSSPRRLERSAEMHPDIARQLAAERHADLLRGVRSLPPRPARRHRSRLRRGASRRYAGAPAGARTGT